MTLSFPATYSFFHQVKKFVIIYMRYYSFYSRVSWLHNTHADIHFLTLLFLWHYPRSSWALPNHYRFFFSSKTTVAGCRSRFQENSTHENSTHENSTQRKFHPRKFHPRKFHPAKIPPTKIPPSENSTHENSTQRKFHPRKFYPRKFHPAKIPPTKIPPTKIPPTKIPPTKIPPSENSTHVKFHPTIDWRVVYT